jgi:methylated-DNA-[protein]-cysteine S-methyltransferase
MNYTTIDSPVGELLLAGDEQGLSRLAFAPFEIDPAWEQNDQAFDDVRRQLAEYFAGERQEFAIQLALKGNAFEVAVWNALLEITYGKTASYGQIARRVGRPHAARAVGLANGRNPVAVIVPCHRVIGANGSLTGYGGGLDRKRHLLDLEAGVLPLTA